MGSVVGYLAHLHHHTLVLIGTIAVRISFVILADWGVLLLNHLVRWLVHPARPLLLQKLHPSHQSLILFPELPLLRILALT